MSEVLQQSVSAGETPSDLYSDLLITTGDQYTEGTLEERQYQAVERLIPGKPDPYGTLPKTDESLIFTFMNLGNLVRGSSDPIGRTRKYQEFENNFLAKLATAFYGHFCAWCEASYLDIAEYLDAFMANNWLGMVFSQDRSLCIATKLPYQHMRILFDNTGLKQWKRKVIGVRFMIVSFLLGADSDNRPLYKAGLREVRILLFHIHNSMKNTMQVCHEQCDWMWAYALYYEVDIAGGDCNKLGFYHLKGQRIPNFQNGILNLSLRKAVREQRLLVGHRVALSVGVQMAHSNDSHRCAKIESVATEYLAKCITWQKYKGLGAWPDQDRVPYPFSLENDPNGDYCHDCMVTYVFSWGHGCTMGRFRRGEIRGPVSPDTILHEGGRDHDIHNAKYMSFHECVDYRMNVSEFWTNLNNSHMFLPSSDKDSHNILHVTIKQKTSPSLKSPDARPYEHWNEITRKDRKEWETCGLLARDAGDAAYTWWTYYCGPGCNVRKYGQKMVQAGYQNWAYSGGYLDDNGYPKTEPTPFWTVVPGTWNWEPWMETEDPPAHVLVEPQRPPPYRWKKHPPILGAMKLPAYRPSNINDGTPDWNQIWYADEIIKEQLEAQASHKGKGKKRPYSDR